MRIGQCLLVKDGKEYGVRVDEGDTWTTDLTIAQYVEKGIQPPWRTLKPCPGMK